MTEPADNDRPDTGKKRRSAALKGAAGVIIAIGGLAFALKALFTGESTISFTPDRPALLGIAVLLGLFAMGTIGANWWAILRSLSSPPTSLWHVIAAYYPGQLGKYLPGGLWPIVGRGELLYRTGTPRSVAYASVAISLMLTYLAAALVAIPVGVTTLFADQSALVQVITGVVMVAAILILVHPKVFAAAEGIASKLLHRQWALEFPPWHVTIAILATSAISWVLIGVTTWLVATAYTLTPPIGGTISSTALSWLAGFVIIPVPGGIGVREAVFVATIPELSEAEAALVALSSRIVFVAADITGAVLVTAAAFITKTRNRSTKSV